jgi:hypothetical protein
LYGSSSPAATLTHPTLDLLQQLGLNGMAKAFGEIEASGEATALTHPEWLALLLDREVSYRRDRRANETTELPQRARDELRRFVDAASAVHRHAAHL